ncbi:MAG: adenylate/guanylate cyclase domain-containing protein [Deltaproteobacteria bacterium]|nr:adenylate/guanylate cyclase domain-containing protein [Deltaproteobacteria bacterium]
MDIKEELRKLVPSGAFGLLGIERASTEPIGDADLTLLFTDIDDYAAITDRLGDDASRRLVRAHDAIVRAGLAAAGGVEVKHTGDGIMAYFSAASRALGCAVAVQRAVAAHNAEGAHAAELRLAIGLNSGAPIAEDGDLFGTAVITAARITDRADGGQILISDVVRQLAAGKGFRLRALGTEFLAGLSEPVPLFEVLWQEEGVAPASAAA